MDYQYRGHVDIRLLRLTLKLQAYQFYVCGPKAMMEGLVPALEEWGVPQQDIHYEAFGPASLARHAPPAPTEARKVTVEFRKSGRSLPWEPRYASLLEFAEAHGIAVESGCRAGSCGCCQTPLLAGEVEYAQTPDANLEAGACLLCISTPKTDVSLSA